MAFLDDKSFLDIKSVTDINSLFFFIRDNGNDRKTSAADMQSWISQQGLSASFFVSSAETAIAASTVTTIQYDTASSDPYGMFNPATPGIITMPFAGMVQLRAAIEFGYYNSNVQVSIHLNSTKNGAVHPGALANYDSFVSFDTGSMYWNTHYSAPFSVAQGDVLAVSILTDNGSMTISNVNKKTFIEVIPLSVWW